MKKLIILLNILLLASCSSTSPMLNGNSPINIYGVTAKQPQNGDWVVMVTSGYQATLGSKGANKNESHIANVSIFELPSFDSDTAFFEHIAQSRAATPNTGRFENQENDEHLVSFNGADCVKYHSVSIDRNAKTQAGKASMILESIGYNCQHPKNNTIGVNIEYSSRYFEGSNYSTLRSDSDAFFKGVSFTDF